MIYEYYTGGLVFLLGFALIYSIWQKRKDTTSMQKQQDECGRSSNANIGECRSDNTTRNDVIIVGAGVAGSALAYTLGKDGRRVHVIERDLNEPNRLVGEVLQPGGYLKLFELGLEDCVTEIDAQQVMGYVLYKDGRYIRLSYSLNSSHSDVAGRSFHHGRFIQKLRKKAASLPNVKLEQGTVTSLLKENGTVKGVQYKTKTGQKMTAYASLSIVCDGCFSNLLRSLCNPKIKVLSYFVGWGMENCQLPYANRGHIILAEPSPVLIYPISSTETRCCVEVAGQKVPSISNGALFDYLKNVVAPQIPPELYSTFVSTIDKGNIKVVPTCSMSVVPYSTPGAFLMGDALNMRHPLIGAGMTVALSDVVILSDLLRPVRDLSDASALCKHIQSFYTLRKPMAITINTLATILYRVFSTPPDLVRKEVRQACFEYLSLGDVFTSRLVALLSGVNPSRISMLLFFSFISIYSTGRMLLTFPSPKHLSLRARFTWGTMSIIFATMKADREKQLSLPAIVPPNHKVIAPN